MSCKMTCLPGGKLPEGRGYSSHCAIVPPAQGRNGALCLKWGLQLSAFCLRPVMEQGQDGMEGHIPSPFLLLFHTHACSGRTELRKEHSLERAEALLNGEIILRDLKISQKKRSLLQAPRDKVRGGGAPPTQGGGSSPCD